MPVFKKFPDFRKFCTEGCVQWYRQKWVFRKFSLISGNFHDSDWHLCIGFGILSQIECLKFAWDYEGFGSDPGSMFKWDKMGYGALCM